MIQKMKQIEVLNWAFSILKEDKREEHVAEILLQDHLGLERSAFYMNMREFIQPKVIEAFKADINAHVKTGVPVQHLLGYDYFYGEKFIVNEHTLIPRPETEELVDLIIKTYPEDAQLTFVDLGTGSGVIAITLAKHFKEANIYATDISSEALQVAEKNALLHAVEIEFHEGDFLKPIIEKAIKVDVIVSNPPYIDYADLPTLADTVKDFDPHQALFADKQGLAAYQAIMEQTHQLTEVPEKIFFEIGHAQAQPLLDMYDRLLPKYKVEVIKDMNEKDRIVLGKYVENEVN